MLLVARHVPRLIEPFLLAPLDLFVDQVLVQELLVDLDLVPVRGEALCYEVVTLSFLGGLLLLEQGLLGRDQFF